MNSDGIPKKLSSIKTLSSEKTLPKLYLATY